jgi:hypothetical protein
MSQQSAGWEDKLASLKHVFPQFPADRCLIWQRPNAEFKSNGNVKSNPNVKNNYNSNVKTNSLDAATVRVFVCFRCLGCTGSRAVRGLWSWFC